MDKKPSPQDVIYNVRNHGRQPSKRLRENLERMFEASKQHQTANGVSWNLTFNEYLELITQRRMQRMEAELKAGKLKEFMKGAKGYVLTTKNRTAYKAKIYDPTTVEFVNRNKSLRNHRMNKGDTHSEKSKEIMSIKRTGTTQTEETKQKISEGNKGKVLTKATKKAIADARTGTTHSEETKAKQRAAMQAYHAARRAAKEAQNGTEGV
ncbi:NUMOD3 domain-containing DNA-binding protein [Shinella oryzae]|uniref:NUMOD3 domain-containing DNA-binding protein n=1 Tax=Shinella oryzae TaxID=2871820 RepID=UPI001FF622E4|nr:NUMOD3 domain-containing DNA-binding protein [Shinella oryzae]UPA25349.1 hypothetical protein K6301_03865 [Shinella oryzae]